MTAAYLTFLARHKQARDWMRWGFAGVCVAVLGFQVMRGML